ncbi:MAG TPA: hypothetical protein ENJ06_05675 [Phycisphaeraceae bacterium]|nr:hypothetical protein [Phycisphaeraceae bacterium]
MERLRLVKPTMEDDAEPAVIPFPNVAPEADTWRKNIRDIENLMADIEKDVAHIIEELETDTLPFVIEDENDWPPRAA